MPSMSHVEILQDDDVGAVSGPVQVVSIRNRRDSQQDAALVTGTLCAVADGMGGHADGAHASRVALEALAAAAPAAVGPETFAAAVAAADEAVRALSDGGWRNPGTTVVAVAIDQDRPVLRGVWVGDSRAYLVNPTGRVTLLTDDHIDGFGSLLRALGDHGRSVWSIPDTFTVTVGEGLSVLLCSDGVSGPADARGDREGRSGASVLAELLPGGLRHLVTTLAAAGSDNATAVLIDVDAFAFDHTTGTSTSPGGTDV
jgi:PPM family protein phosphatase